MKNKNTSAIFAKKVSDKLNTPLLAHSKPIVILDYNNNTVIGGRIPKNWQAEDVKRMLSERGYTGLQLSNYIEFMIGHDEEIKYKKL